MKHVTPEKRYLCDPVLIDQTDPPVGVREGILKAGDTVRCVELHACPPAGTMGHCFIQTQTGTFAGLVSINSLQPYGGGQ